MMMEFADQREDEQRCKEARRESARRRGMELGENFSDEEFTEAVRAAVSHARHGASPLRGAIREAMARPKRKLPPYGVAEVRRRRSR
jgi:hypothetical protein